METLLTFLKTQACHINSFEVHSLIIQQINNEHLKKVE